MPFQVGDAISMDLPSPQLSVVDVYEIASGIGKEFEKVIDLFGADPFTGLMPKVVAALEQLESFAARSERDISNITELRNTITRLETEKIGKAEDRERFEKELEQIEENWRDETKDLLDLVSKLKEENRRLSSSLEERQDEIQPHVCPHEQDLKVLHRMKEMIDQQRDQLRAKDKELSQRNMELEALQCQVDRITQLNKELRRKHRLTQNQTRIMIEEKAELQAQLQEQCRVMQSLRQSLGVAQKDKEDLVKSKPSDVDLTNKVVYDIDDPERPRFTMSELKSILSERNELKARVSELEDELEWFKPKGQHQEGDEDDPPVQGPINKEPDDAPWKKQDSSIRKLFRVLFGETSETFHLPLSRVRYTSHPEPSATLQ